MIIRIVLIALMTTLSGSALLADEIKGTVTCTGKRNNAYAVVYVDAIAGKTFEVPKKHAIVDQKDMVFEPHVLPILVGTTVDFLNSDSFLHNVFTPAKCAEKFNLGSWPKGQTRSYTFKKPCVAVLLCNVHQEMEGYIVALPTPYYALTDKSGSYEIRNLPAGTYSVKVWHPELKQAKQEVTVKGSTNADFQLKR